MTDILDAVVIFLLIIAIVYGFVLNRKIVLIHDSKKELANLFKSFDKTILKAQVGIDSLKQVSSEVSNGLDEKISKAAMLLDDLSFASEKASDVLYSLDSRDVKRAKPAVQIDSYSPEKIKSMRSKPRVASSSSKSKMANKTVDQKAVVLEDLLSKISENQAGNSSAQKTGYEKQSENAVVDMLKALGYGES